MDLSDALDSEGVPNNQRNLQAGGPTWPGQPTNPSWPGQPQNPAWPGQPHQPWPGQQPNVPSWPNQPNQPAWPSQPNQPAWPGQPSQPNVPGWPGQIPPTAPQNMTLTVPYDMPLPHGVYDKMLITIQGEPKPNAQRFSINLCKNEDIAFHLNPRFDENGITVIVRNTKLNDVWGAEERAAASFPFVLGKPFEVKILCTQNEFKVAVNKAHLIEYKHRVRELNKINHLTIFDDVKLTSVNVETLH